jgi:hypothetical protein
MAGLEVQQWRWLTRLQAAGKPVKREVQQPPV